MHSASHSDFDGLVGMTGILRERVISSKHQILTTRGGVFDVQTKKKTLMIQFR